MKDRGMMKWMPFDSLTSSKKVLQEIMLEKNKIKKPILSLEQLEEIETLVWVSFHNQIDVSITYFINGFIKNKKGVIVEIDSNHQKIILEDHTKLYFDQILKMVIS